jgi:hypothetical protein
MPQAGLTLPGLGRKVNHDNLSNSGNDNQSARLDE